MSSWVLQKCCTRVPGTVYSSSRTPDEWVRALSSLFLCFFACFPFFFLGGRGELIIAAAPVLFFTPYPK